jgi:hypothetical protein
MEVTQIVNETFAFPVEGETICLSVCDKATQEANTLIRLGITGDYHNEDGTSGDMTREGVIAQPFMSAHITDSVADFEKPSDSVEKVVMSPSTFASIIARSSDEGITRGSSSTEEEMNVVCHHQRETFKYKIEFSCSLREFSIKIQSRIRKKHIGITWKDGNGELITVQSEGDWTIAKNHLRRQQTIAITSHTEFESVWECGACTFLNLNGGEQCEVCCTERAKLFSQYNRISSQLDIYIEDVEEQQSRRQKKQQPTPSKPVWGTRAPMNSMLGGGFVGNIRRSQSPSKHHYGQCLTIAGQAL